ncbi:MAG TPA: cell division protein FtsZ [Solirubrobacteraceae bacterium]|nr:cell division protein FtsZ [Solirubrobacteraceae bacterium]
MDPKRTKRASMREGPLAALFRRTDEEEHVAPAPPSGEPASAGGAEDRGDALGTPGRTEPAAQPAQTRATAEVAAAPQSAGQEAPSALRSPQERLREVFSEEIPENIMERAATTAERALLQEGAADAGAAGERRRDAKPVLRVIGVGGAGVNAVNRMVEAEVAGVEFIAINTDLQSLQQSTADVTLQIGESATGGLGSGADPGLGRQAASEEYDRIKALLKGSDMIFVTAGAGGGTGTGGAPIVARIAREVGALTVAIVTKPFGFEGSRRIKQAEEGIADLAKEVDTLITVPNDRLLSVLDRQTTMVDAFRVADDVLRQGVQGISDLVTLPGLINLDFADVRTIMSNAGNALLGIGMGVGENRAIEAAQQAIASPLLEISMDGARSILLSITGGPDLSLWEVNDAARAVSEAAHKEANIIFGAMVDEKLDEQVWVTVVATGYGRDSRLGRAELREPAGEVRIRRTSAPGARSSGAAERSLAVGELEVPEFVPR